MNLLVSNRSRLLIRPKCLRVNLTIMNVRSGIFIKACELLELSQSEHPRPQESNTTAGKSALIYLFIPTSYHPRNCYCDPAIRISGSKLDRLIDHSHKINIRNALLNSRGDFMYCRTSWIVLLANGCIAGSCSNALPKFPRYTLINQPALYFLEKPSRHEIAS